MIKGKTKIILTNVETGEQEIHEDENLVTNAIDKIINMSIAMNHSPNSYLLPIATNLLGGIMLFDNDLTEDADNIHFPSEAHLVAYSDTGVNTSDKYRGSFNSVESGMTEDGYVSVWDFGTSQANGTIKSVARTSRYAGYNPLFRFVSEPTNVTGAGVPTTDAYWYPIRYDGEYLYMLKGNSSTHQMRLARVKIPMMSMGVYDYSDVPRTYEVIATWNTLIYSYDRYYRRGTSQERVETIALYADDPQMYSDGYDGYLYVFAYGTYMPSSDYTTDWPGYNFNYFTIKYSDDSYDKSETIFASIGLAFWCNNSNYIYYPSREQAHVHNGYLYAVANNRKVIHKIPLAAPASYVSYRVLSDSISDYINHLDRVPSVSGNIYFVVYHYTQSGYNYLNGVLYPDGVSILPDISYSGTGYYHGDTSQYNFYNRLMVNSEDLSMWAFNNNNNPYIYVVRAWAANYLGTINNLTSAITKTAAQTMKIIYTLTNVEEDD